MLHSKFAKVRLPNVRSATTRAFVFRILFGFFLSRHTVLACLGAHERSVALARTLFLTEIFFFIKRKKLNEH